jgi:hypothetical protein
MKYIETEKEVPILELLDERTIARINKRFGTNFKKSTQTNITINRKEKSFEWWNRLIRTKPGFDRRDDEK